MLRRSMAMWLAATYPGARVVSVTSTGRHAGCPLDPDNPHLRWRDAPWRAYGQSKLATSTSPWS
jgi:hypothetical protein